MSDDGLYEMLVMMMSDGADNADAGRLTQAEAAAISQQAYGYGGLRRIAVDAHVEYKTVAQYGRVVNYYEGLLPGRTLAPYESIARELLAEFPTLRWTHLRTAKGISKDNPWLALEELRVAVDEGMTPQQFKRHIAKKNPNARQRYVIGEKAGWRTIVERVE